MTEKANSILPALSSTTQTHSPAKQAPLPISDTNCPAVTLPQSKQGPFGHHPTALPWTESHQKTPPLKLHTLALLAVPYSAHPLPT